MEKVNCPGFCTTVRERAYITASGCENAFGVSRGLSAAGTGGL